MSEAFTLDTSGVVTYFDTTTHHTNSIQWSDLSPFAQGCVEGLFEASMDALMCGGWITSAEPGYSKLAPAFLARIIRDCEAFEARYLSTQLTCTPETWGRWFWADRQNGIYSDWPPLRIFLNDQGQVDGVGA